MRIKLFFSAYHDRYQDLQPIGMILPNPPAPCPFKVINPLQKERSDRTMKIYKSHTYIIRLFERCKSILYHENTVYSETL
jgi:hypothetical protein